MPPRVTSEDAQMRVLRLRAVAAETALAEAEKLIAELHEQVSRANAAAVAMAQRVVAAGRRLAA